MLIIGNTCVMAEGNEWVSKVDALNRMGNFSEAIAAYDMAPEMGPNYVDAWDGK